MLFSVSLIHNASTVFDYPPKENFSKRADVAPYVYIFG